MSQPDDNPTDEKVKQLRDRTMDIVADAAVHVQRLDGIAKQLGLTPDLVDGMGDQLYDAAVAQLDVASKILERSQLIIDRLFDLGAQRLEGCRFKRVEVAAGDLARFDFVVRNPSHHPATVEVAVDAASCAPEVQVGQPRLPGRRDTAVEIQLATTHADIGKVYPMLIQVRLSYEGGRRIELPAHDVEVWVRE